MSDPKKKKRGSKANDALGRKLAKMAKEYGDTENGMSIETLRKIASSRGIIPVMDFRLVCKMIETVQTKKIVKESRVQIGVDSRGNPDYANMWGHLEIREVGVKKEKKKLHHWKPWHEMSRQQMVRATRVLSDAIKKDQDALTRAKAYADGLLTKKGEKPIQEYEWELDRAEWEAEEQEEGAASRLV